MNIQHIPTQDIFPDPNQPRVTFHEADLKGLAASIQERGIINALEIDPQHMLITGERRWRAAKLIDLPTVPVKIITLYPRDRLLHQLNENLHSGGGSTMVPMDISHAFARVLREMEGDTEENIQWLAKRVGKDASYVKLMLKLQEENTVVKKYLETPSAKYVLIREASKAPTTRLQERLKEKIMRHEVQTGMVVTELIQAIKRHPDREQQLLARDYKGNEVENIIKINHISPRQENLDQVAQGIDIANKLQGVLLSMKDVDVQKISKYDMAQIKKLIEILVPQVTKIHAVLDDLEHKHLEPKKPIDIKQLSQ